MGERPSHAGGPTTYTLTPAEKGFQLRDGWVVKATFNATNGANATLNVSNGTSGTGATNLTVQNIAGITNVVGGEFVGSREYLLVYKVASSSFVKIGFASDVTTITSSPATITTAQFANCATFITSTAGLTITLPAMSTVPPNGCIVVQTNGVQVSLAPNAADGINGGATGTAVNLPADGTFVVSQSATSGSGAVAVPLGPVQYRDLAWAEGLNLASSARGFGRFATPRTVLGIRCNVQVAGGSASVAHFFSTADGTAPASGTQLDTSTAIDLNAASNTAQTATLGSSTIVSGYWLWMTASGTGTSGSGVCTVSFR